MIPQRAAAVNTGKLPPPLVLKEVSPTSQLQGVRWRFTTQQPAAEWFKPTFNDLTWQDGLGGCGTEGTPAAVIHSEWKSADIWLRLEFEWSAEETAKLGLKAHQDEDIEICINRVLANKSEGFTSDYEELEITPEAVASLKPGKNLISVHYHQKSGGQYVDVGIFAEIPTAK